MLSNQDFARKYADKWLDYILIAKQRGKVAGYYGIASIIVEQKSNPHVGDTWQNVVSRGGVFTARPDSSATYLVIDQSLFILPKDDDITAKIPALTTKQVSGDHYPHKCPRCGQSSYNAMYGGWVDCSSPICENNAKER